MAPRKGILDSFSDQGWNLGPKCPDHEPSLLIKQHIFTYMVNRLLLSA